jgi:hypothetical protein
MPLEGRWSQVPTPTFPLLWERQRDLTNAVGLVAAERGLELSAGHNPSPTPPNSPSLRSGSQGFVSSPKGEDEALNFEPPATNA